MRSFVTSGEADEMREFYRFGQSIPEEQSKATPIPLERSRLYLAAARPSIADARAGEDGP
jgi:hypothetical protein